MTEPQQPQKEFYTRDQLQQVLDVVRENAVFDNGDFYFKVDVEKLTTVVISLEPTKTHPAAPVPDEKQDSTFYIIEESQIDAGSQSIYNIFKLGGISEDQRDLLNCALEQFKSASNRPIVLVKKEHDALVAQQAKQEERERVLKPFERYAKSMRELECVAIRGDLIDMVKSLRQSKGGKQP
jgi:hypothetical protein